MAFGVHDGRVVGNQDRIEARESLAHAHLVLDAAHPVRRDDHAAEAGSSDRLRGTTTHLERFHGGFDDDEDHVDRVTVQAQDRPETGLEVGDHVAAGSCKLPKQLLR